MPTIGVTARMSTPPQPLAPRRPFRWWVDLLASLAMIAASVALIWYARKPPIIVERARANAIPPPVVRVPQAPQPLEGAARLGEPDAPVALIAYSDFECPFCGRFARDVLPQLIQTYVSKGKVQMAFRHLPLPIHREAVPAAIAAWCAGRQGQFWPMHDRLFLEPRRLDRPAVSDHARQLGLVVPAFDACLNDGRSAAAVKADADAAARLGVTSTPTLLVGRLTAKGLMQVTTVINGARPLEDFARAIDALLK